MRTQHASALAAFYGQPVCELTRAQVWAFWADRDDAQHPDRVVALTLKELAYFHGQLLDDAKKPAEKWLGESTVNTDTGDDTE